MPRVIHFEIHADQPERACTFYRNLFDWKITKWEGPMDYYLITTGPDGQPGINGGLVRRQGKKGYRRQCLRHDAARRQRASRVKREA